MIATIPYNMRPVPYLYYSITSTVYVSRRQHYCTNRVVFILVHSSRESTNPPPTRYE